MATPDYSKIWGANSPLAKYEFTEADYLRGWEFIGSMPPARTMFDAWMRKADEKMRWLYDNAFSENSLGGFLFWRLPDTAYFVGEKRALQDGPLDVYLECTIAGRTSKEQMKKLPQGAEIGKTFVDGTATWLVRQFATSAALNDHRKKTPLDHPDGSVMLAHLSSDAKNAFVPKDQYRDSFLVNRSLGGVTNIPNDDFSGIAVTKDAGKAYPLNENGNVLVKTNSNRDILFLDERGHQRMIVARDGIKLLDTPTGPTAEKGTSNTQLATTAFVTQEIAALVNSAPGALDTLQELAKALGNDANFAATMTNALAGKVSKSGDTMTGPLDVSILDVRSGFFGDYKRDSGDAIEGNGGANVNIGSWYGIGFYDTCNKKYTGSMNLRTGDWRTLGKIRADQGVVGDLAGTADNANKLGGQSLQWIVDQINAAKTGIVAGNLAQNGWVKFANGLIVQWGVVKNGNGIQRVTYPIAFTTVFHINFCSTIMNNDAITNSAVQSYGPQYADLYSNTSPNGYILWFAIGI